MCTQGGHLARGACHPTGLSLSGGTCPKNNRRRTIYLHIVHTTGETASLRTGKDLYSTEMFFGESILCGIKCRDKIIQIDIAINMDVEI